MARVNIEERFFAEYRRTNRVAELMGWHRQRVKGALADLWFASQEALRTEGSAEDIAFWADLDPGDDVEKFVLALCDPKARFLKKLENDRFEVAGNDDQIGNRVKNVDAKKKGGRATREKWKKLKAAQNPDVDARLSSTLPAGAVPAESTPSKAVQASNSSNSTQAVQRCKQTWAETLAHFKIDRGLSQVEETAIARAIQKHGPELVELALFGARFEKPSADGTFNPAEHVSLFRVLDQDAKGRERIEKFANLGSAARGKAAKAEEKKPADEPPHSPMPEDIKALFNKFPKRDAVNQEETSG